MAMVTTRLGELRVEVVGSGPPAVLWHSLFVDATSWDGVRSRLSEHRQLVIIDGPGHGGSACPSVKFTLADCADAAGEVLDGFGFRDVPVDWVGNAWGGHVGVVFAARTPGRCRSLVTIGTPIEALTTPQARQVRMLLAVYRLTGPITPLVKPLCDALIGRSGDAQYKRLVAEAFRRAARAGMANAVRSISLHRPNLTADLAAVTAPTLFVAAADDPTWTPDDSRVAAAFLPNGQCEIVAGGGHVAALYEAPGAIVSLIQKFWRAAGDPVDRETHLCPGS